jgi:alkyldihydroxyacetonephosphate synthase
MTASSAGPSPRPIARWSDEPIPALAPPVRAFLRARLGDLTPAPATDPADIEAPPSRLDPAARDALAQVLGPDAVRTDRLARLRLAAGSSYADLLRLRSGDGLCWPDAVVAPATEDQVRRLLAVSERHRLAVVPVGGGTSVVGGVEPDGGGAAATVCLDLSRLAGLVRVDATDRTATFLPGTTGPQAESLLAPHGLALGHVPQSFARASLGGYAATRSAGQASTGFGRFDAMVVALRLVTPRGTLVLGTGTPNATGPDLRHLAIGSEGAFGVITEVTVRVRPAPQVRRYEGWMLPDLAGGLGLLRDLVQDGPRADSAPDVCRLSDPQETEVQLALRGSGVQAQALDAYLRVRRRSGGCLAVLGWEGAAATVRQRRAEAVAAVKAAGGVWLGTAAGEAWRRHRFDAPSQRDALLDAGVLVETLETATTWSRLPALREAVRSALVDALTRQGTPPVVFAHVSHVYPTGASVYTTVLARRARPDAAGAREQWRAAKAAATEALLAAGGTLTHHHAVGRDHTPWLDRELGPLGVDVLRGVKATLDPAGVLNPGVLVPQGPPAALPPA